MKKEQPLKGKIMTRRELADTFGVSATTVDLWVRKGCPYVYRGGKGVLSKYDSGEVFNWVQWHNRCHFCGR